MYQDSNAGIMIEVKESDSVRKRGDRRVVIEVKDGVTVHKVVKDGWEMAGGDIERI